MTANIIVEKKPLIYGLIGLATGALAASLITYNLTIQQVPSTMMSPRFANASARSGGFFGGMVRSDQHFIVMMIPHHEDAIAMADLALSRAKHPEIKQLAATIKATQTQEIQQMRTWYKQWYNAEVPEAARGMGMMYRGDRDVANRWQPRRYHQMQTDLAALKNAPDFDREFMAQMIPHHQMAVMMSTMLANRAEHPEIRTLAQSIIKSQSAEIDQMQQWDQTWYPQ
jgi:uncharacterized protein (DUF305 family)